MRATKERVAAIGRLLDAETELYAAQEQLLKLGGWHLTPTENGEFHWEKTLPVGTTESRQWHTLKRTRAEALALELEWTDHSGELLAKSA